MELHQAFLIAAIGLLCLIAGLSDLAAYSRRHR